VLHLLLDYFCASCIFAGMETHEIKKRFEALEPFFDEKMRRTWAAAEAAALGYGGVTLVATATGISRRAITEGKREIETPPAAPKRGLKRIRREGGGRRPIAEKYPGIGDQLEKLVEPVTRGDPMSPLLWTSKSVRKLAGELAERGYAVSYPVVAALLKEMKYSLQANRKTTEGSNHADRDAQFEYIYQSINRFQANREPVISVDTKKKELVGEFKNNGREWRPQGKPEAVRVHDFETEDGKVAPYGVYDVIRNEGWVNVGTDNDTATFAVESIRRWWLRMGKERYPKARDLLITADGGGSNGARVRLWKVELQKLADEIGLDLAVSHLPPGTSKWNKIEHRLFSHITMNWRGKPLVSHEVIVNLIASTRTDKGLTVQCALDTSLYPKGVKVSDSEMALLNIQKNDFHGEWNYIIRPR
jgi:hypothetical protein